MTAQSESGNGRPFIGYVAYIDEAGDDGLGSIYPLDANGATEWFALGSAVVPIGEDNSLVSWVNDAAQSAGIRRLSDIHFKRMNHHKRTIVCDGLSKKSFRSFCVVTNKINMRGYKNRRASGVSGKNYFYNFLLRILLERVTKYCAIDAKHRYPGKNPMLHVCMSDRGGMAYGETKSYLGRLWIQSQNKNLFLNKNDIDWSIFRPTSLESRPHEAMAGLQIADVVVSALYKGLFHEGRSTSNVDYAMLMARRMAGAGTRAGIIGNGLQVLPWRWRSELSASQTSFFFALEKAAGPQLCDPTKRS